MKVTLNTENNIDISVTPAPQVKVEVVPPAQQTINISRGVSGPQGPQGAPGPNTIGGYGFNISGLTDFNALMFRTTTNQWTNIPQEEISDGGNF
jgi:hypothetical protein